MINQHFNGNIFSRELGICEMKNKSARYIFLDTEECALRRFAFFCVELSEEFFLNLSGFPPPFKLFLTKWHLGTLAGPFSDHGGQRRPGAMEITPPKPHRIPCHTSPAANLTLLRSLFPPPWLQRVFWHNCGGHQGRRLQGIPTRGH